MKNLAGNLARLKSAARYRVRRIVESPQSIDIAVDGQRYLSFCSNDYLGLAQHPAVVASFQQAAARYGVGSGASHLITGHNRAHHALEEELAAFTGRPRALLFSTGYMANLGVISALLRRHDVVIQDRYNHASLLDGALLAQAKLRRYPHGDMFALRNILENRTKDNTLIVSDGVFSMDGDIAPLPQLASAAKEHQAWVMIDDAHGIGVLGATGRGTVEHFGLQMDAIPILVGTFGKALGTFGAFVAGSEELIETLIQTARSYIYTTAVPPAVAEATRTSLRLVTEEAWRREHLHDLVQYFCQSARQLVLPVISSGTPIIPFIVGDANAALQLSEKLRQRGILIPAIRPPTVPTGSSRLRISLSAAHSRAHIDRLLAALKDNYDTP